MEWLLSSQRSQAYVLRFTQVMRLRVAAIWNQKSAVQPLFSLSGWLFLSVSAFLVFYLPSIPPLFFSLLFFLLFSLSTVITVWRGPGCPCVLGLMAGLWGLLDMGIGGVLLSRGWRITVEAPGHHGHPPSTQLDAVVNLSYLLNFVVVFLFKAH